MASRAWGASMFALGAALRAGALACLAFGVVELVVRTHLYATALVLGGLAVLVAADLIRFTRAADRMLQAFLAGITAGAAERPTRAAAGFPRLARAMDQIVDGLDEARAENRRVIDSLEAMLDAVAASLLVVDQDGSVKLANRAARALAGQAAQRLEQIPALGAEAMARLAALAPGGREIVRLADGRRVLASAVGFSVPGRDRRRLIALQSLAGELDIVELGAWRDLVRILAHEMMNSLTPIVSLAESLEVLLDEASREGAADPASAAQEAASAVKVIARRSVGLMNFVERYRKLADLPQPVLETVALAGFADDLDRLMRPLIMARGAAYASRVTPSGLTVKADPDLLQQAVINLLKNAVDAVDGAPAPRIELCCRADAGGVIVAVSDNGPGLAWDELDKVFVPFFTTKSGGSGIGLSLALQIALAHHGRLTARRNEPHGGAIFELALPSSAATPPE